MDREFIVFINMRGIPMVPRDSRGDHFDNLQFLSGSFVCMHLQRLCTSMCKDNQVDTVSNNTNFFFFHSCTTQVHGNLTGDIVFELSQSNSHGLVLYMMAK